MTRRPLLAAAVATFVVFGHPAAQAATYPAAFDRAVAYWYLPTNAPDVYRMYRVEVVRIENLVTGEVSARASVVMDRCTERWLNEDEFFLACDRRRERLTQNADLVVAPDLSSGKATFELDGRTHVVRFEGYGTSQRGFFERDRVCSQTSPAVVAGPLANTNASGRVLGQKLDRPYRADLDHAWLESGAGTWCDEDS